MRGIGWCGRKGGGRGTHAHSMTNASRWDISEGTRVPLKNKNIPWHDSWTGAFPYSKLESYFVISFQTKLPCLPDKIISERHRIVSGWSYFLTRIHQKRSTNDAMETIL